MLFNLVVISRSLPLSEVMKYSFVYRMRLKMVTLLLANINKLLNCNILLIFPESIDQFCISILKIFLYSILVTCLKIYIKGVWKHGNLINNKGQQQQKCQVLKNLLFKVR